MGWGLLCLSWDARAAPLLRELETRGSGEKLKLPCGEAGFSAMEPGWSPVSLALLMTGRRPWELCPTSEAFTSLAGTFNTVGLQVFRVL